jgi:hypothetical protein
MTKNTVDIGVDIIELENDFKVLYVSSKPPRIEAKIVFDRDSISQKLIFTMMDIAHRHGFGCSPPKFGGPEDSQMSFLIGTILPSSRSLNKYLKRISSCLFEVTEFTEEFARQLDFSRLDLTMFNGMEAADIYPEQLTALKDQIYNGSWKDFRDMMSEEGKEDVADIILRCMKFEKKNNKDLGLVGHKLGFMLEVLDEYYGDENLEVN